MSTVIIKTGPVTEADRARFDRELRAADDMTDAEYDAALASDPDIPRPEDVAALPDVAVLRARLGLSAVDFARRFHIPLWEVEAWERGDAIPASTALTLLRAIEKDPETVAALVA